MIPALVLSRVAHFLHKDISIFKKWIVIMFWPGNVIFLTVAGGVRMEGTDQGDVDENREEE